mmetsp:Transcript_31942/g.74799  ORF Transcript_31942/g.74799 Transcript_31942/m.74799 type:complete len:495 (-) Transcript_31942:28-1512(-)
MDQDVHLQAEHRVLRQAATGSKVVGDGERHEYAKYAVAVSFLVVALLCVLFKGRIPRSVFGLPLPFKFPFKRTLAQERGRWEIVLMKWAVPFLSASLATLICMWMMHIGTSIYVRDMFERQEFFIRSNCKVMVQSHRAPPQDEFGGDDEDTSWADPTNLTMRDRGYGALHDPFSQHLGWHGFSLVALDVIAAGFPVCFVTMAVLMDELGSWTKIMLCNTLLALGKGVFSICTVIPDSSGWEACQARLTPEGVSFFNDTSSPWDLLIHEITHPGKYRWCADMMWSGHTYFTTLYALGLYELIFIFTREWPIRSRWVAILATVLITVGEQMIEIYVVLLNHFHYTMDVLMAILLTFLFFTNGVISAVAKFWVRAGHIRAEQVFDGDDLQSVLKTKVQELRKDPMLPADLVIVRASHFLSGADVSIPICCIPFCSFVSRQHTYTDNSIRKFFQSASEEEQRAACDDMRISYRYLFESPATGLLSERPIDDYVELNVI